MVLRVSQYVITKKIAKHGSQAVIVVPRILEKQLPPRTVVKLTIDVLEKPEGE
jgi:hypothetical protein